MPSIRFVNKDHQILTSNRYAMFTFDDAKYVVVRDYIWNEFLILREGNYEVVGGKGIPLTQTRRKS